MSPTANLRWVQRADQQVLQQLWVKHHIPAGLTEAPSEWRDVPVVRAEVQS